jgi:hypothetical protein
MATRRYSGREVKTNEAFRGSTVEWHFLWSTGIPPGDGTGSILDAGAGEHVWGASDYARVVRCDNWQGYGNRRGVRPSSIVEADLNGTWPFEDDSFVGVTCIDVVEHLENPWHFLREATRVATGWVCIGVPNPHCPLSQALFAKHGTFYCFTPTQIVNSHHRVPMFSWQVPLLEQACGWKADINQILNAPTSGFGGWEQHVPPELHAMARRGDTQAARLLRFRC